MGDKMDYRVASDDTSDGSRGKMAATWMQAAGENGIPTAFLINGDGKVAYIGHPMTLDTVLKNYTAGKLDIKAEATSCTCDAEAGQRSHGRHADQRFSQSLDDPG